MLRHRRYLILLYPLLLATLVSRSQQKRRDTLILHFPLNSFQIQPDDSARLMTMLENPAPELISIIGYTDKTGTTAYNQWLSQQRAASTHRLIRRAVASPTGAQDEGHSGRPEGRGVAPTAERSDSENRRVEIVYFSIVPGEKTVSNHDTIRRNTPSNAATPARRKDSIVVIRHIPGDTAAVTSKDSTQPSAVLALRHINFIVDTPVPTDSTRRILPEFIAELRQFKDHHLEIDGYVNSIVPLRGPNDPLFKLSVNRAKFIYDYLVEAGFDPGKLTYKGMGNSSPINPHPMTKQEMNANMRVEIRVY